MFHYYLQDLVSGHSDYNEELMKLKHKLCDKEKLLEVNITYNINYNICDWSNNKLMICDWLNNKLIICDQSNNKLMICDWPDNK